MVSVQGNKATRRVIHVLSKPHSPFEDQFLQLMTGTPIISYCHVDVAHTYKHLHVQAHVHI